MTTTKANNNRSFHERVCGNRRDWRETASPAAERAAQSALDDALADACIGMAIETTSALDMSSQQYTCGLARKQNQKNNMGNALSSINLDAATTILVHFLQLLLDQLRQDLSVEVGSVLIVHRGCDGHHLGDVVRGRERVGVASLGLELHTYLQTGTKQTPESKRSWCEMKIAWDMTDGRN